MPYGTMSVETGNCLAAAGIDVPAILVDGEEQEGEVQVDVIFGGALDESFSLVEDADYHKVVDAIADCIAFQQQFGEAPAGEDWTVVAYVPEHGDLYRRDSPE